MEMMNSASTDMGFSWQILPCSPPPPSPPSPRPPPGPTGASLKFLDRLHPSPPPPLTGTHLAGDVESLTALRERLTNLLGSEFYDWPDEDADQV